MPMPTLGLVSSTGDVVKLGTEQNADNAIKDVDVDGDVPKHSTEEGTEEEPMVIEFEVDEIIVEEGSSEPVEPRTSDRPRLPTTLLILKKPQDDEDAYFIANPITANSDDENEIISRKKHKKKKKKSKRKENCISPSYAEKLLEIQKSISRLSANSKHEGMEEVERRRKTHAISDPFLSQTHIVDPANLKTPTPVARLLGKPSSLQQYTSRTSISRKRQISTCSSVEIPMTKRRYTRKKRLDLEEVKASTHMSGGEDIKKSHLSENNVWNPMDDFRLLVNITQTKGNLEDVFAGTKFSCFYTVEQVSQRWKMLLYDDKAGSLAQTAISNLHPIVRARIQAEALFSDEEEDLLKTIKIVAGGNPDISHFKKLLEENPHVFYHRTSRKLLLHWIDMKEFHLLESQDGKLVFGRCTENVTRIQLRDYKDPFNLFDLQDSAYLATLPDLAVFQELLAESKQVKRQIRLLDEEVESWQCMQELVVSDGTSDLQSLFSVSEFDDQTYAVVCGKHVRYCMRSKEILLGRHSTNNKVDADLTLEGASGKVSRRQAVIQMHDFGEFYIINQGKSPVFIDNIHVPYGGKAKLTDGCVIQVAHIKLLFKINEKLVRKEISHQIKTEVINARLKSFDTFSPSTSFPSLSTVKPSTPSSNDVLLSTSRFSSPKKKSVNSTCNSPVIGVGHTGGITTSGGSRFGNARLGINPTMGNLTGSDSIAKPSSSHSPISSFISDNFSKTQFKNANRISNDNDIFKKPAPVSIMRQSSNKSSPVRTTPSSTATSSVPTSPSAFVSVGPSPFVQTSATSCISLPFESSSNMTSVKSMIVTPIPANLTTSHLSDCSKPGFDLERKEPTHDPKSTSANNSESVPISQTGSDNTQQMSLPESSF